MEIDDLSQKRKTEVLWKLSELQKIQKEIRKIIHDSNEKLTG